jgi:iron complex transport system substrate-binding protein
MNKFKLIILLVVVVLGGLLFKQLSPVAPKTKPAAGYHRIVAVTPSIEEIVFALAEPQDLAAATDYNRHSPKEATRKVALQIKNVLPERPGTEAIIALQPDLVFLPTVFGHAQAETLQDCGFKVVQLDIPNSYADIKKRILLIARTLQVEGRGQALCASMDARLAAVQEKLTPVPKPKVAIALGETGAFGRKGGAFDNICQQARLVNGAASLNLHKGDHLSKEQLVAINPDVIICSQSSQTSTMYQQVLTDPAFKDITAIKGHHVVVLDERYLNSTTQNFVEAVEQVAAKVYPECFTAK